MNYCKLKVINDCDWNWLKVGSLLKIVKWDNCFDTQEKSVSHNRVQKTHNKVQKTHNKVQKTHNKVQKTHNKVPEHTIKWKNTQTGNTIKTKGLG
jgi:hypothetical protein